MRGNKALVAILIATLGVGVAQVSAAGTIVEAGWGPLSFNVGVQPRALPKQTMAPVALGFSGRVSTNGKPAPALTQMTVDFDRNGAIDASGLPRCARSRLQILSTENARRVCRKSIVGAGVAHVDISTSQRKAITLTLFNGGVRGGVTTIFVHGVVPTPTPTPAIATAKIRRVSQGRFGLRSITTIPLISGENGSLHDFSVTIERRFMRGGAERSFAMARCIDGHLDARLTGFSFSTGEHLQGDSFVRPCASNG